MILGPCPPLCTSSGAPPETGLWNLRDCPSFARPLRRSPDSGFWTLTFFGFFSRTPDSGFWTLTFLGVFFAPWTLDSGLSLFGCFFFAPRTLDSGLSLFGVVFFAPRTLDSGFGSSCDLDLIGIRCVEVESRARSPPHPPLLPLPLLSQLVCGSISGFWILDSAAHSRCFFCSRTPDSGFWTLTVFFSAPRTLDSGFWTRAHSVYHTPAGRTPDSGLRTSPDPGVRTPDPGLRTSPDSGPVRTPDSGLRTPDRRVEACFSPRSPDLGTWNLFRKQTSSGSFFVHFGLGRGAVRLRSGIPRRGEPALVAQGERQQQQRWQLRRTRLGLLGAAIPIARPKTRHNA